MSRPGAGRAGHRGLWGREPAAAQQEDAHVHHWPSWMDKWNLVPLICMGVASRHRCTDISEAWNKKNVLVLGP